MCVCVFMVLNCMLVELALLANWWKNHIKRRSYPPHQLFRISFSKCFTKLEVKNNKTFKFFFTFVFFFCLLPVFVFIHLSSYIWRHHTCVSYTNSNRKITTNFLQISCWYFFFIHKSATQFAYKSNETEQKINILDTLNVT